MAGFKTHITTSTVLGVGYTGAGLYMGVPVESSIIAGGLCGIGGMLPDIDSDSGIPFRESMGFAAAIIPILLMSRFQELGLNYEQLVLASGGMYLFVRFGLARLLARYTVHRGMFHSLPAALLFGGVAFLLCKSGSLQIRYFKTGGVLLGVMSHLLLDEIYAVEWHRGRWRFKKSFGTAMKLWGPSLSGNLSVYIKLAIVLLMILGEPMVLEEHGQLSPVVLKRDAWAQQFVQGEPTSPAPQSTDIVPPDWQNANDASQPAPDQPEVDQTIYDTARRIWRSLRE